jgi:hypothetical protein
MMLLAKDVPVGMEFAYDKKVYIRLHDIYSIEDNIAAVEINEQDSSVTLIPEYTGVSA